jgi:hypothetical protein
LKQEEVPECFKVDDEYPDCFRADKVRQLVLQQASWFDESHKKQKVGKLKNGKKIQMRFEEMMKATWIPMEALLPKDTR